MIELSPNDVLIFVVEDMSDFMQSSTTISCSSTVDDDLVLFEVT
jgi:hypothetical protein